MNKDEFNKLCARIMGYKDFDLDLLYDRNYNPHNDLNHMEDVFNKVMADANLSMNLLDVSKYGIRFAMRQFIERAGKSNDYKNLRDNMTYEHNRYMTMRED